MNQLARDEAAVFEAHDRNRAERARRTGAAGEESAVDDDAAADERAEKEVKEIVMTPAFAEEEFRRAGRRGVVAQNDGDRANGRDFVSDVDIAPDVHRAGRRADF